MDMPCLESLLSTCQTANKHFYAHSVKLRIKELQQKALAEEPQTQQVQLDNPESNLKAEEAEIAPQKLSSFEVNEQLLENIKGFNKAKMILRGEYELPEGSTREDIQWVLSSFGDSISNLIHLPQCSIATLKVVHEVVFDAGLEERISKEMHKRTQEKKNTRKSLPTAQPISTTQPTAITTNNSETVFNDSKSEADTKQNSAPKSIVQTAHSNPILAKAFMAGLGPSKNALAKGHIASSNIQTESSPAQAEIEKPTNGMPARRPRGPSGRRLPSSRRKRA